MTESRVDVIGATELDRSLSRVADDLGSMERAGQEAATSVKSRAQSAAPVNTGFLARSISAENTGAEVTVGAYAPYAGYQEFGTVHVPASPYLRPALEAAQSQIVDAYTGEIQTKLGTVKGA